jgi:hypothetical protein
MLKRAAFFMALEFAGDAQKGQTKVFLSISVILGFTGLHVVANPFVLQQRNTLNVV